MTGLISNLTLKQNSHHDEKETCDGNAEDPGEAMFSEAGYKGQWGCEEDDEANRDMNPGAVGVDRKSGKKERKEGHHYTVNDTGCGKGNSHAIPNFFHSGHIAEPQQSVYNAGKLNLTEKRR